MRKVVSFLFSLCLLSVVAHAQVILASSVIASGGGYAASDNLSISWTLGELAVTTLSGGDMILTQGFQQPFDIGVGIGQDEVIWEISAYPNPVKDELRIRFNIDRQREFWIEVQDVTGRLISLEQHKQIYPGDVVPLNTSKIKAGIYFLKVFTPDRKLMKVLSIRKL